MERWRCRCSEDWNRIPVGAYSFAKAVGQSAMMLRLPPSSRMNSLPRETVFSQVSLHSVRSHLPRNHQCLERRIKLFQRIHLQLALLIDLRGDLGSSLVMHPHR